MLETSFHQEHKSFWSVTLVLVVEQQ